MSRIGNQPIQIPENAEVTQHGNVVTVSGPHGELSRTIRPEVSVSIVDGQVMLSPNDDSSRTKALWGTFASHIANMVQGVTEPFQRRLTIQGVGYRAEMQGEQLVLNVGFTHPVYVPVPNGVTVSVEESTIVISGIDKELVGEFAARVRAVKKPEPYKGKGIRYEDEVVRMKEGKTNV